MSRQDADISAPLKELCLSLGLPYDCVSRLVVTPGTVLAEVYLLNERGEKYINEDTNHPACELREFKVVQ